MPRSLVAVLALALASPVAADWRSDYLDGRRALERGRPAEAVALLAAAAASHPEEQARARLVGVIPEPYLPHHYLGLAHFALHDCAAALAAWATSERQGAVAALPAQFAEAAAGRRACEAPRAQVEPAVPDDGAGTVEPPPPPADVPAPVDEAADEAAPSPPAAEPVPIPAATSPAVEPVAPSPPPPPAPWSPDATLLEAAGAYLDGEPRRVLELLAAEPAGRRARAWTHLLRAAAWHALHRLEGDVAALEAMRGEVRAVRREEPGFRPSPDVFPPSFVALFAD